jgi:predicted N-formylglutamate amidohydrolase
MKILRSDEPPPVTVVNPHGESPFVLVCEHAGKRIPASLDNLGLPPSDLARHIAWDIGAADVARNMAGILGATLFLQTYSRLVCDGNRQVSAQDFVPENSENTHIPGNIGLSTEHKLQRAAEIFHPFHDTVAAELDRRKYSGKLTILATIHSFTPIFKDVPRPWHIGVLYNRDQTFAPEVLSILRETLTCEIGDNQPYAVDDETDYAIPVHGEARGLPCVEFEIRNDLIGTLDQQGDCARNLCTVIESAAKVLP